MVQHQVHAVEGAGAEAEEGEAAAAGASMLEEGEEWVQQAGWSGAARGRRQRLEGSQEDVMEEARARQAGVAGKTQTLNEKASADESYEERQMLWKGMAGRSWTELMQQWSVLVVESLQLQTAEVDCSPDEGDRPSAG